MKNLRKTFCSLGIGICLIGAFLTVFGEPIMETPHTGLATVVAINGIGIITAANKISF